MIYVQLFLSFLQVGMFSVGGGYAAIPLIQSQVVEQHGWLTMQEFTDLVTIAEMTPGPIAVNAATFVGLRIAQVSGAIVATLGCITPALFFVSLLSYIYRRYKDISLLQSVLACLRGTDLWRRAFHPVDGGVWRRCKDPRPSGLGRHRQFCRGFFCAAEAQMEPHPDHVPVRRGRAWAAWSAWDMTAG